MRFFLKLILLFPDLRSDQRFTELTGLKKKKQNLLISLNYLFRLMLP